MAGKNGGRRPGAGRKPDPVVLEFRAYWRKKFDQPRWRKWLALKAMRNERILCLLVTHAYGQAPQSVKIEVAPPEAKRTVSLAGGERHASTVTALPDPGPN